MNLDQALQAAREAAAIAADIMLGNYRGSYATWSKPGARGRAEEVLTQPDLQCDAAVRAHLEGRFPQAAIVSEESADELAPGWHEREWIWYIDPIDGSLSYLEGSDHFGIAIGLTFRGRPVLGVINNPLLGFNAWGIVGEGAYVNGRRIDFAAPPRPVPRLLLSFGQNNSRSYRRALELLRPEVLIMQRSLVTKTISILTGQADYYFTLPFEVFHGGRPNAWDLCGPAAIIEAAGGFARDIWGDPLIFAGPRTAWERGHLFAHPLTAREQLPALAKIIEERRLSL
jgi:fructose-1,6-bisphosphatase/inositol monophosphatase family enzyme